MPARLRRAKLNTRVEGLRDAQQEICRWNDSVKNEALQLSRDAQEGFEVIADPNEPCSHCLMHSKSGASYPLKSAVQNSSLNEIVSVESRPGIKNNVPSCLTQIDLHDHSPPGSNASRYVLNSAFRI